MFKFFYDAKFKKITSNILTSKKTYIILVLIILIQFILVSIIFLQNKKNKYLIEQTSLKVTTIENQQKELSAQINGLQSAIMRMSAQMYRLQGGDNK